MSLVAPQSPKTDRRRVRNRSARRKGECNPREVPAAVHRRVFWTCGVAGRGGVGGTTVTPRGSSADCVGLPPSPPRGAAPQKTLYIRHLRVSTRRCRGVTREYALPPRPQAEPPTLTTGREGFGDALSCPGSRESPPAMAPPGSVPTPKVGCPGLSAGAEAAPTCPIPTPLRTPEAQTPTLLTPSRGLGRKARPGGDGR